MESQPPAPCQATGPSPSAPGDVADFRKGDLHLMQLHRAQAQWPRAPAHLPRVQPPQLCGAALSAASEPGVPGTRGQRPGRQVGLRTWPDGQAAPPPRWHLEGGAALGWWGPREGRGRLPGCTRCHPQAARRKGAPGGFPPRHPSPVPGFPSPAELWLWPGSRQLRLSGTGKTRCAYTEAHLCPQAGV